LRVHKFNSLDKSLFQNPVITIGIFDGVHKGHLQIIQTLKDKAKEIKGESVLVTLWPHPRMILYPDKELKLLVTFEEKLLLLEQLNIDHLVIIPFDKEIARITAQEFIRFLVEKIGMRYLVIGFDNHFGHNKEGNFNTIAETASQLKFKIIHLPAVFEESEKISSTNIRVNLELGDVEKTAQLLGYNYSITGKVVKGSMLGRTIGFPTANIEPSPVKMLPRVGVYAVMVNVEDKKYMGMLNIGFRPTVEKILLHKTIEVYIINFKGDLYDKEITVTFAKRLRDEVKFSGIDELKIQLEKDKEESIQILKGYNL